MCRSCSWAVYTFRPKKEKKNGCSERIFSAQCVMHMKFEVWLFLSHRWNVRKEVKWSKPQWVVGHLWVRMSCWGRFFAVLISVVCVAPPESLACCAGDAWAGFCFRLQFSGWGLSAPVDVSEPVELPWQGQGPSQGMRDMPGVWELLESPQKKLFPLGNGSPSPCSVWALQGLLCTFSSGDLGSLAHEIFSWCALTVCHLPYWGNQESGVPWKMILGKKLSLFLWHTFETRKPCNVCTLLSFKSSLCGIFSQGNVYILNFHFWREDFLLPLLAGFGVLVTLLGRGDVDKLHGRV